jgi:serpin B
MGVMASTSGHQPLFWLALLTITLLLGACASPIPTASPVVTATPPLTSTPTLAPTPAAPATPIIVATPTPLPTETPTAVPTEEVTPETTVPPSPPPTPVPTPTSRPTSGPGLAISTVARAPADPAAAKTAAASISAFGLDLFRQMLADPKLGLAQRNAVFSPTSIALALGMARAGAKGETAAQMDAVLHTSGWDALRPGLNSLDQALASRDATWKDNDGTLHALALRIANAAFAQAGWTIEQSYLDRIAAAFGAGVRLVDYISNHEAARQTINTWVSQRTEGRIPELLPRPIVTTDTRLVLVNAIYLKANWATEFNPSATAPRAFTRLDGSTVEVPTMSVDGGQQIPYAQGTGWQAVDLAYRGAPDPTTGRSPTPVAMTVILPKDLASFEQSLSAAQLGRITAALEAQGTRLQEVSYKNNGEMDCGTYPYSVNVLMPRFSIDTQAQLGDVLKSLGMPLAFGGAADFTGIHVPTDEADRLFISEVIHQANIDVDEKGTTAAAATAVVMATGGCTGPGPAKVITFRLDRPFLFALRDVETGAVLFMGQVTDPSVGKGG